MFTKKATVRYPFNPMDPRLKIPFHKLLLNDTMEKKKFEKEIMNAILHLPSFNTNHLSKYATLSK